MQPTSNSPSQAHQRWLPTITFADVKERTRKVLLDRPDLRDDVERRIVEGAMAVLECYLGVPWLKKNIVTKRPDDFLVPPSTSPGLRIINKGYSRILDLAECLLSMQRVDGIVERVCDLKKKDLQGCFCELQGAMLLRGADVPFRFRKETNVKRDKVRGGDFDVIALVNGQEVDCEMKAKCEGTKPSRSTLRTQLKNAKDQVPKGKPNIVFVRLPETWMNTKTAREEVAQGIEGHFRDSTRVSSVVIHWEEWTQFPNGRSLHQVHFRQHTNPRAPQFLPGLQAAINTWIAGKRANWFSLHRAICSEDEFRLLQSKTNTLELAKVSLGMSFFGFMPDGASTTQDDFAPR